MYANLLKKCSWDKGKRKERIFKGGELMEGQAIDEELRQPDR